MPQSRIGEEKFLFNKGVHYVYYDHILNKNLMKGQGSFS